MKLWLGLDRFFRRDPRRRVAERLAAGDGPGAVDALSRIEDDGEMLHIGQEVVAECLHRHQGKCPPQGLRVVIAYLLRRGRTAHAHGETRVGPDEILALFLTPVHRYRHWEYLQEIAASRDLQRFLVEEARQNLTHFQTLNASAADRIAAHQRLAGIYHLLKRYDKAKQELCEAIRLARRAHQRAAGLISLGWVAILEISQGNRAAGRPALARVVKSLRREGESGENCIRMLTEMLELHKANPLPAAPR